MTAETTENLEHPENLPPGPDEHPVPSFAKALFVGDVASEMVFPYPRMAPAERDKVVGLVASCREVLASSYDQMKVEQDRWVGDEFLREMGDRGLMGLYVDEKYGGQGLGQTGYCRVSEEFGIDATLSVVMGVHQSIGTKPIHLFGTDDQKARWLPDLASGRKLAGFGLTEPGAGSDAYHLETRAERQADGSWVLNGEKRWIGNGSKDVVCVFARSDSGHVCLVLEKGMAGFESPERFDTLGLRGNNLRRLTFTDVRVPKENLIGEAGEGFKIAMHTLNNGRMSLGTGVVGSVKRLIQTTVEHTSSRRQFGRPLAEFELVEEKVAWMSSYLFGLESLAYLTTGLVDAAVEDYSLESAIAKIAATEFIWYAVNRSFQLAGGSAYMSGSPWEKSLRDVRIFPIFEGANDVLRTFVALSGLKSLGDELADLRNVNLSDPVGSIGLLVDYAAGRLRRTVRPGSLDGAHKALAELGDPVVEQAARLRATSEKVLRVHGSGVQDKQLILKRLCDAVTDIYAQVATVSRVSSVYADQGVEASGQETYLAETFCNRAARRVSRNLRMVDHNDDERMHSIARLTYNRGGYSVGLT